MDIMHIIRSRIMRAARGTAGTRAARFSLGSGASALEQLHERKRTLETDIAEAKLGLERARFATGDFVEEVRARNFLQMIERDMLALDQTEEAIARHQAAATGDTHATDR